MVSTLSREKRHEYYENTAEKYRYKASEAYKRNTEMLKQIKLERGCMDCGFNAHSQALDFDHVRGEKSFILSAAGSRSTESIMTELKKCEVVCANCHRIRTATRMDEKLGKHP